MINKFLTLPLFIAASVVAHPAPLRRDVPSLSQWASSGLESYWSYKVRFQSLHCSGQEGSDFYNTCCNPLPAGQTTANLPAECQPATLTCAASSPNTLTVTTSSAAPAPSDNGATTQSTDNNDNSGSTNNSGSTDNSGSYTDDSWNNNNNNNNNNSGSTNNSGNSGSTNNSGNSGSTNNSGSSSSSSNNNSNSGDITGGFATFYYQNGNAGACGNYHSDSDLIGAIDVAWYGDLGQQSQYCGRSVTITNLNNGKSVTITVADVCPTCDTNNSFDLSYGAFTSIASEADGEVPITWHFN